MSRLPSVLATLILLGTLGLAVAPTASALHERTPECAPADHPVCVVWDTARHAPHQPADAANPPPPVEPCPDGWIGADLDWPVEGGICCNDPTTTPPPWVCYTPD